MTILLLRTRAAIEDCEKHLQSTGSYGTEVESYLTQHILVLFCADVQQEIYNMLDERAKLLGDEGIRQFVVSSGKRILRSVHKDQIANFVELFGLHAKEQLNSALDDKDVTIYNNAVGNRHDVAHKYGVQVTFREVQEAVDAANRILEAVKTALYASGS